MAVETAAKLKHECECETQKAHEEAWTQAHHMICVVDNTTYESCDVPACPTVTKPHICEECAAAECTDAGSHTAVDACGQDQMQPAGPTCVADSEVRAVRCCRDDSGCATCGEAGIEAYTNQDAAACGGSRWQNCAETTC